MVYVVQTTVLSGNGSQSYVIASECIYVLAGETYPAPPLLIFPAYAIPRTYSKDMGNLKKRSAPICYISIGFRIWRALFLFFVVNKNYAKPKHTVNQDHLSHVVRRLYFLRLNYMTINLPKTAEQQHHCS